MREVAGSRSMIPDSLPHPIPGQCLWPEICHFGISADLRHPLRQSKIFSLIHGREVSNRAGAQSRLELPKERIRAE